MKTLIVIGLAVMASGCSVMGGMCDETRVDLQYTHVSHPLAGAPFGPKEEEDALHTLGPMGRCTVGRGYVDLGVGYKLRDAGFYGPELTGTVNVGVNLWNSSR